MNHRIFKFLLVGFFVPFMVVSCGDGESSDNPAPITAPDDPGNGNSDGDGSSDAPWAVVRFERHTSEPDPTCVRPDVDIMIIQEDGRFHLEECDGVKDGQLTRTQRINVRNQMAGVLRSDLNRKICAESSPLAELYLHSTMDTGAQVKIYEELTAQGLCSYGDRSAALKLYRTVSKAFDYHDIEGPITTESTP